MISTIENPYVTCHILDYQGMKTFASIDLPYYLSEEKAVEKAKELKNMVDEITNNLPEHTHQPSLIRIYHHKGIYDVQNGKMRMIRNHEKEN